MHGDLAIWSLKIPPNLPVILFNYLFHFSLSIEGRCHVLRVILKGGKKVKALLEIFIMPH